MSFWFLQKPVLWDLFSVFSTYVEVILKGLLGTLYPTSILHVCGGDPWIPWEKTKKNMYSPRMWRWSLPHPSLMGSNQVFSTYVEVILCGKPIKVHDASILHVCGGDPRLACVSAVFVLYSPRMWRWSLSPTASTEGRRVFSTYVEVILRYHLLQCLFQSILHVCGGDPTIINNAISVIMYSPRMWRWSLPLIE